MTRREGFAGSLESTLPAAASGCARRKTVAWKQPPFAPTGCTDSPARVTSSRSPRDAEPFASSGPGTEIGDQSVRRDLLADGRCDPRASARRNHERRGSATVVAVPIPPKVLPHRHPDGTLRCLGRHRGRLEARLQTEPSLAVTRIGTRMRCSAWPGERVACSRERRRLAVRAFDPARASPQRGRAALSTMLDERAQFLRPRSRSSAIHASSRARSSRTTSGSGTPSFRAPGSSCTNLEQ